MTNLQTEIFHMKLLYLQSLSNPALPHVPHNFISTLVYKPGSNVTAGALLASMALDSATRSAGAATMKLVEAPHLIVSIALDLKVRLLIVFHNKHLLLQYLVHQSL
jgi:hypothetical protein